MASFRPFPPPPPPPQTSFQPAPLPPNQNPLPPPPPPSQTSVPPYIRPRGFSGGIPPNPMPQNSYGAAPHHFNPPRNQPQQHPQRPQQYPFAAAPPPPPSGSYPLPPPPPQPHQPLPSQQPPPPPPPVYYAQSSSQFPPQYNPPAPPSSPPPPPPSSPPPPPPAAPPPPLHPPSSQSNPKDPGPSRSRVPLASQSNPAIPPKHQHHHQKLPTAPPAALQLGRAANQEGPTGHPGRVETEEERRARKRREYEKQRQEEKRQHMLKQSQATVLQKTQMMSAGAKAHGSIAGSRMAERKTTPLLSSERIDNRLKKPTTFLCKLKFRNELPDPTAQPKLLSLNTNKDRYTKYAITSLEKLHKPKLYPEHDLGIPLDVLDISIYKAPDVRQPLAPEDEELLRDGEMTTPIKHEGIRKKDRPTDKGVSWLVKTQYISPLSMDAAKMSLSEKQVKEMRETREGRNLFLENLNNREKQIQAIEESFKASKLRPMHQSKPGLQPKRILPLLPDFDRYDDRFVTVAFDGDPTADSEAYNKLDRSIRDEHESHAIMKSFVVNSSDPSRPEKFLAYMVPAPDELSKDIYDESEDTSYSWVREYHWDVRGDVADDPTTYLVSFDDDVARYLPLPTKLVLQKKKAKEGRSGDEIEHYPVPSSVTVRRREAVAVGERKESGHSNLDKAGMGYLKRIRSSREVDYETQNKHARVDSIDQYSGEEDASD